MTFLSKPNSNTLPTPEREPILLVYEKTHLLFFGPFVMEIGYKKHQYTSSYLRFELKSRDLMARYLTD